MSLRSFVLDHFELALENKAWSQALEKLEQAKEAGLSDKKYEFYIKELERARTAGEQQISERVEFLMEDALKLNRSVIHEMARSELISLKNPVTFKYLIPYVDDPNESRRLLAIESLAWMEDPSAAEVIAQWIGPPCTLRYRSGIKPRCPEGDRYCGTRVWKQKIDEYSRIL